MKKVLVLVSLSILALSFACGGSNEEEDAKTANGQSAFVFNSMIPAIVDGTDAAFDQIMSEASVSIDESPFELTPIPLVCDAGGNIEVTGTASDDYTMPLTFEFNACSVTDPICNTAEKITANGSLGFVIEVVDVEDDEYITFDTSLTGTLTLSGLFEKSCEIKLNTTGTQVDISEEDNPVLPEFEDFNFTGTVCGVKIQDILAIEEAEREELCETI